MTEYLVKDSHRAVWRRMQKAMQKSYLKVLTEPITNSDDSYKRLGLTNKRPIYIYVTKKEKKFEVVDFAEGLDKDQMKSLFQWYGQEKETHDTTSRGLFGQGLSDVLFTRSRGGHLYSIKDGEVYHTEFKWKTTRVGNKNEKERIIRVDDKRVKANNEWREKLHIPHGNGTCVTFHFTEAGFPSESDLVKKLCNFYMIRFITTDPLREVKVIYLEDGEIKKEFPIEFSKLEGEELGDIETSFSYKNYPKITVKGTLFKSQEELPQDEADDERVGGLLIFDEYKNVYDLSLFAYDGNPHAKKLFGYLELSSKYKIKGVQGFKNIIRQELNQGEELLTDTRDGFAKTTKKSSFYFKLKNSINPWLKKFVEKELKEESQKESNLSEKSVEEQKKAFDILSKLYARYNKVIPLGSEEGKADKKPENGLEFDRLHSILTKDKKYYIGIRVNTDQILVGSKIYLSRTNDNIKYSPRYFEVKEPNEYGVFKINIAVNGKLGTFRSKEEGELSAKYKDEYESRLKVTIIEEDIYEPQEGLEFHPLNYRSKPGNINTLHLYIDKSQIPIGEVIKLKVLNGEKITLSEFDEVQFTDKHIIKGNIGIIKIPYIGYKDKVVGQISANWNNKTTAANIEITYKKPKEEGNMFDDWDYKPLPTPFETYPNFDTRKIEINANIETNRKFLGENYQEATANFEKSHSCQIIVAERVMDECITASIYKAYGDGKLDLSDAENRDIFGTLRRMIAEEKKKLSPIILKRFITLEQDFLIDEKEE